jgi:hypothetical protein
MTNRIGRILALTGVAALAATVVPSQLHAQAKAELTPFVGSFYALAKMCSDCNNDGSNLRGRLQNSAAVGARLSYWVSNSLGIEASGAFTPSRIEISASDTTGFSLAASAKGNVIIANARLLYRPARTNLHFIIGGGIVKRGGDLWKLAHDSASVKTTSPSGVIGVAVRAAVTPKFALSITAEDHLYSFDPGFGPFSAPSNGKKLQSDLLITIGIPVTLSR